MLVVLAAGWYFNTHWKQLLRKELGEYVSAGTDGLYQLHYKKIRLNILTGNVSIDQVQLVPDSAVYQDLINKHRAPKLLYKVEMEHLNMHNLLLWKYFIKKQAYARSFVFYKPKIEIIQNDLAVDTSVHGTFYGTLKQYIKSIYINQVTSSKTELNYTHILGDSSRERSRISDLNFIVRDLLIDSVAESDPRRFLYATNFDINLEKYEFKPKDSLYNLHFKDITYRAAQKNLELGSVHLEPKYNIAEFDRRIGTQKDRYDILFRDLDFNRLYLQDLLKGKLYCESCNIDGANIDIYRNRSLPLPAGDKMGQFPSQVLKKLELPLKIDTLKAENVNISYTELNPKNGETGSIYFKRANGIIRNITNNDSLIARNNHCIANINAVFMETGKLRAKFDFPLDRVDGSFNISGQLKDMNGKELNPVTRPLGMVAVESLRLHSLDFAIAGNEHAARADIKFLYSRLRISILEEEGNQLKRKGLMSTIANLMAIYKENPEAGKDPRLAVGKYTRDPKKSFFNLVWKTLFDGVMQTVGTQLLWEKTGKK